MFKTSEQTDSDSESTALTNLSGDISNLKTSLKSENELTESGNFSKTDDVQVDAEQQSTSFAPVEDSNEVDSAEAYCDVITKQPSTVERLPVPTVKSVNITSAETHIVNNELEKQRSGEPYQRSKLIVNTDYISPSNSNYTSSSLLVNNNSCTSKAFKNIRHLKRYQQRNIIYNEPVNKMSQPYKLGKIRVHD